MCVIAGRGEDAPITYSEPITMPNAQHTPGPWHFDRHGYALYVNSGNTLVAALSMDGKHLETSEANARLIAAAPNLLEVLRQIISDGLHCDVVPHLQRKARAAIRQATGQE